MNKNIGDMTKEELYDLCNELLDKDTEYMLIQRRIDKAIEELQDLTDEISNKTIIGLNQFLPKLRNIQEILGDKENE